MTGNINQAVESTWALVLARFVMPAMGLITMGLITYSWIDQKEEITSLRVQVYDFQERASELETEQARLDERQKFQGELLQGMDRRVDRLEEQRRNPIADARHGLSVIRAMP